MNRLQERRLELGLTQPEVSQRLKAADSRMDVGMVSRFERGACLPTPEVLTALEEVLQASRTDLFGADELSAIQMPDEQDKPMEPPEGVLALSVAIGRGRENATTRAALCERMGLSDRKVRELIEQARRWGYIIINEQDGRGYYLSVDPDDMERQYRQDTNRALAILSRRKNLRRELKEAGREV